ncbi:hypothetical protein Mp_1g04110 [Marchantia polymorpha subsp. ruderalis]|uniref:Uncharacterized protein n=2 Tax=Marchantia polymorpha TaxID=3197 RepID=A0AAF6ALB6_MARPO|nr:hypothetical protein MARPO_0005s0197 [Marchantia polymorpha]BBM97236.1 hypothetical protein Mp_1g04110 [Marchantia polymorpha subsp. ruderalis]|eukprot:PTQ48572.1 hypothetical protein MARPO_0005s0197 [Marchantia polymorpha]
MARRTDSNSKPSQATQGYNNNAGIKNQGQARPVQKMWNDVQAATGSASQRFSSRMPLLLLLLLLVMVATNPSHPKDANLERREQPERRSHHSGGTWGQVPKPKTDGNPTHDALI